MIVLAADHGGYLLKEEVKKHLNKNIEIEGALLTMFDTRTNLSKQVVDEVNGYFGDKVYKTVIPRNVRLAESPSHGKPILCTEDFQCNT